MSLAVRLTTDIGICRSGFDETYDDLSFRLNNSANHQMFTLELELSLYFVPPMEDNGRGITLLRVIELPFAPHAELAICGSEFGSPGPMGFVLKDLTWDTERKVFLATTSLIHQNEPIGLVPDNIATWLEMGWHFGSHDQTYDQPDKEEESNDNESSEIAAQLSDVDWDELDGLASKAPRSRPAEFNQVFRAVACTMAALYNNLEIAYAMLKTQRFFTPDELKDNDTRAARDFCDAQREFDRMSSDEKWRWRDKVIAKHQRLEQIVASRA